MDLCLLRTARASAAPRAAAGTRAAARRHLATPSVYPSVDRRPGGAVGDRLSQRERTDDRRKAPLPGRVHADAATHVGPHPGERDSNVTTNVASHAHGCMNGKGRSLPKVGASRMVIPQKCRRQCHSVRRRSMTAAAVRPPNVSSATGSKIRKCSGWKKKGPCHCAPWRPSRRSPRRPWPPSTPPPPSRACGESVPGQSR